MTISFNCDQQALFKLTRMLPHEEPLKEFWIQSEAENYSHAVFVRQYSTLKDLGLID